MRHESSTLGGFFTNPSYAHTVRLPEVSLQDVFCSGDLSDIKAYCRGTRAAPKASKCPRTVAHAGSGVLSFVPSTRTSFRVMDQLPICEYRECPERKDNAGLNKRLYTAKKCPVDRTNKYE